MQILITVSDPWDFGESVKWQPFKGELLQTVNDERGGRILIKLDNAINHQDSVYRHLVAAPRHQGSEITDLHAGIKILCAFTGISDEQAKSSAPLDTSNWRGGLAFVGEVEAA